MDRGACLAAVLAVSERHDRSDLACLHASPLQQQSTTFLAPGTDFVENNFSVDGVGMVSGWVKHSRVPDPVRISCQRWSDRRQSSGGNASDGEWLWTQDEASLACPPLTSCEVPGWALRLRCTLSSRVNPYFSCNPWDLGWLQALQLLLQPSDQPLFLLTFEEMPWAVHSEKKNKEACLVLGWLRSIVHEVCMRLSVLQNHHTPSQTSHQWLSF